MRLAKPGDLDAIAKLSEAGADEDPAYYWSEAGREIELPDEGDASKVSFVAEVMAEVVGFAQADYFVRPDAAPENCVPEGWYLRGLTVRPDFRGRGIGAFLTDSRLSWLASRTKMVRCSVDSENRAAIALHKQMGFREVRRDIWAPNVPFSDTVTHILYELSLESRPVITSGHPRS